MAYTLDDLHRLLEEDRIALIWRSERILALEVKIAALEAENAALRTQSVEQWSPIMDGTLILFDHPYDSSNNREIDVSGNKLALCGEDEVGDNAYAEIQLPNDLRLCRYAPANDDAA